jgi:hypothetical protein
MAPPCIHAGSAPVWSFVWPFPGSPLLKSALCVVLSPFLEAGLDFRPDI